VTPAESPAVPQVGTWVVDTRTERLGVVRAVHAGRLYLRQLGGGCEWEAMPVHVRLVADREGGGMDEQGSCPSSPRGLSCE